MAATKSIYKSKSGQEQILELYNRVLSEWPVANDHIIVPTRFGDTFVVASGDIAAPALVLLHGSGSNSATWAHDVIEYSKHFRIFAVDIPGEPGNSAQTRFSCKGPAFVGWLEDVLNGLNVQRATMGGISLGAWAVLKYATHNPNRVENLVLICPSGIVPPKASFALRAIFYMMLGEWGLTRMKNLIFQDASISEDAVKFFLLTGRYFSYRVEAPTIMSDDELRCVRAPAIFLAGEKDVLLQSKKTADRLQKLVPNITVKLFKDNGHAVVNMASEIAAYLTDVD